MSDNNETKDKNCRIDFTFRIDADGIKFETGKGHSRSGLDLDGIIPAVVTPMDADAGIDDVWIHMNRDTPEALSLAQDRGVNVHTGSCAVMYLVSGFNAHTIHGFINKVIGKY